MIKNLSNSEGRCFNELKLKGEAKRCQNRLWTQLHACLYVTLKGAPLWTQLHACLYATLKGAPLWAQLHACLYLTLKGAPSAALSSNYTS
jgi:hypothetical protein